MKRILLATTALVLSSPVFAADLSPAPMPVKAPAIAARPFSWTGCYIGGHLGGDWGSTNFIDPNNLFNVAFPGSGLGLFAPTGTGVGIDQGAGFVGGGQIGCDYQFATNWVAGLAGDFSWTNLDGSTSNPYAFFGGDPLFGGKAGVPATLRDQTDWLASVTGRVGYAWDRWMLYGKGGVAWEHSRDTIQPLTVWGSSLAAFCFAAAAGTSCNASGTDTDTGWTVGVGLTWAFADNWSAGIEYDHYGFGNHSVTLTASGPLTGTGSAPITVNQNIEVVKATLDYHFNWFAR
jgi:outer membrane immunogenic protein